MTKQRKKVTAETALLSLTRSCPLKCAHCLRGNAQDVFMDFETAKAALDSMDVISSLVLTGGEPLICSDMIEQIVNYIIDNNKEVYGFYMATSGKVVDIKALLAITRLYAYIHTNFGIEEANFAIDISNDQYHEKMPAENRALLNAFSFVYERGEIPQQGLIREGRAKSFGFRNKDHSSEFSVLDDSDDGIVYELVYVNAKGNIYPDCDFSYETEDRLPNVHITSGNICDLMDTYNEMLASR